MRQRASNVVWISPVEGSGPAAGDVRSPDARVVADVMTRDVITVGLETPVRQAARRLLVQGVPGLVVVDANDRVAGVLTEQDLVVRLGPRRQRPWWNVFVDHDRLAREYQGAVGISVGEIMNRPVITASPRLPLASAALLFDTPGVSLVPVVDHGCLVGSLSCHGLIEALLTDPAAPGEPSNAGLVAQMQQRMAQEGSWVPGPRPAVDARGGIPELWL